MNQGVGICFNSSKGQAANSTWTCLWLDQALFAPKKLKQQWSTCTKKNKKTTWNVSPAKEAGRSILSWMHHLCPTPRQQPASGLMVGGWEGFPCAVGAGFARWKHQFHASQMCPKNFCLKAAGQKPLNVWLDLWRRHPQCAVSVYTSTPKQVVFGSLLPINKPLEITSWGCWYMHISQNLSNVLQAFRGPSFGE